MSITAPVAEIERAWAQTVQDLGLAEHLGENVHFLVQRPVAGRNGRSPKLRFPALVVSSQGEPEQSGAAAASGRRRPTTELMLFDFRHDKDYAEACRVAESVLRNLGYPALAAAYQPDEFGLDLVLSTGQPVTPRRVALVEFARTAASAPAGDSQGPTPAPGPDGGLNVSAVDARIADQVEAWALDGNEDPIPASKLTEAPAGRGTSGPGFQYATLTFERSGAGRRTVNGKLLEGIDLSSATMLFVMLVPTDDTYVESRDPVVGIPVSEILAKDAGVVGSPVESRPRNYVRYSQTANEGFAYIDLGHDGDGGLMYWDGILGTFIFMAF